MATIAIIAIGSHGDVAPLTGVGARLQRAGHRVIVVAYQAFAELVTGSGLEFRGLADELDGNSAALSDVSARQAAKAMAAFLSPRGMRVLGDRVLAAVRDEPVDALLLSPFAELAGHPLADALAVPGIGVRLQPFSATADYPPAVLGAWSAGRFGNRAAARIGATTIDGLYGRAVNHFRAQLGLPTAPARVLRRRRTDAGWPILYGYSPTILPRPADWRPGIDVVGYWWPERATGWQPPTELVDFLDAGPPPIVIGFGSTVNSRAQAQQLSTLVAQAIRRAGARAVIQSGWAGLDFGGDDAIAVGEVPHDWLFAQAAAVVHHCGAGTAAAGLRAGVPAIAAPGPYGDQPFWARRLFDLGVSPQPIPQRRLSADNLSEAIRDVLSDNSFGDPAAKTAAAIAAEDGAGGVLAAVEKLLG
ncbi:glycosyltransferase [Mycolicibacterium nivoides]|uniref:glycosyltransferase n=1 Tax=Mycolicibacterium nivoides TaxID=2487344 RepID=UPI0008AFA35D|nr:glycosyltransferase [Mycolicibacterium nivoides]SER52483.1 UDP:flavonoid glycosyltransferase YjiC, YdhE family [Mycobacterium sp. 88mf]SFG29306.1 UDP:flavonoid glycosyltransferase YjiC, YdhE family [Mycobacterium sp. 455mf]